jgi:hypothetical protein
VTATTFAWINITTADGELIDRFQITLGAWKEGEGWPTYERAGRVLPLEAISDALARVERQSLK